MARICIIGTEGAGKTVFISVLAKRYEAVVPGAPSMEFKNRDTARYVAQVWNTLAEKHDWPPSTPTGALPLLEWSLHVPHPDGTHEQHSIKVLDAPGQDIRAIYDSDADSLNENQLILKQNIQQADILLLLVNLGEAIRATNSIERTNIELPIKMALEDVLSRKNTKTTILLSQHDQLQPYLESIGVSGSDPLEAIRVCLPSVYGVAQRAGNRLGAIYVSSVAETVSFVDESGNARSRPKENFKSEGLEGLMSWLCGSVTQNHSEVIEGAARRNQELKSYEKMLFVRRVILTGVLSVLIAVFGAFLIINLAKPEELPPYVTDWSTIPVYKDRTSIPVSNFEFYVSGQIFVDDDVVIRNRSKSYYSKVDFVVEFDGKHIPLTASTMFPGETATWGYNFGYGGNRARLYYVSHTPLFSTSEREEMEKRRRSEAEARIHERKKSIQKYENEYFWGWLIVIFSVSSFLIFHTRLNEDKILVMVKREELSLAGDG